MSLSVPGIYQIRNTHTGDFYVGSTVHVRKRWSSHRAELRGGRHGNGRLQAAWRKYGEAAFAFLILAVVEPSALELTEQRLLDRVYGRADCYNLAPGAGKVWQGRRHSPESIEKMRLAMTGRSLSESAKEKLRARKGEKRPNWAPESRARLSAARTGTPLSAEHREAISKGGRGLKRSPETRARIAEALRRRHATARLQSSF